MSSSYFLFPLKTRGKLLTWSASTQELFHKSEARHQAWGTPSPPRILLVWAKINSLYGSYAQSQTHSECHQILPTAVWIWEEGMGPIGNKQEDASFSACSQLLATEKPPQPSPEMGVHSQRNWGKEEERRQRSPHWDPRSSSSTSAQTSGSQGSEDGGWPIPQ